MTLETPSDSALRIERMPWPQWVVGALMLLLPLGPLVLAAQAGRGAAIAMLPLLAFPLIGAVLLAQTERVCWSFDAASGLFSERRVGLLGVRARTLPLRRVAFAESDFRSGLSQLRLRLEGGAALVLSPSRVRAGVARHREAAATINMFLARNGFGDPAALFPQALWLDLERIEAYERAATP